MYTLEFDKVIWEIGLLHMKMALVNAIGDWLKRSG